MSDAMPTYPDLLPIEPLDGMRAATSHGPRAGVRASRKPSGWCWQRLSPSIGMLPVQCGVLPQSRTRTVMANGRALKKLGFIV